MHARFVLRTMTTPDASGIRTAGTLIELLHAAVAANSAPSAAYTAPVYHVTMSTTRGEDHQEHDSDADAGKAMEHADPALTSTTIR